MSNLLLRPVMINHLQLKNRMIMPPMATSKTGEDGMVTDALIAYYDEKTKNGKLGLVIVEHSYVSPDGKAHKGQLSISKDEDIPGLKKLTDVLHANHTPVFAQLSHAGSASLPLAEDGQPKGPSATSVVGKRNSKPGLEMNQEDIDQVIEDFVKAAKRARKAGFDGIEIHSAHGYLLNQFYSPLTNKRTDSYSGAPLDGRIHLHLQIIAAIRKALGEDFPISLRLGACDYMEGGSTREDSIQAAKAFEKAGVDLISISGGLNGYLHPTCKEEGYFSELSQPLKEALSIPVLLTGGIVTAKGAERLLEEEKADLIGIGRILFREPDFAKLACEILEK